MAMLFEKFKQYPIVILCLGLVLVCVILHFLRSGMVVELEGQESQRFADIRTVEKNKINASGLDEDLESLKAHVATIEQRLFFPSKRAVNTNFFYAYEDQFNILITRVNQQASSDPTLSKDGINELKEYGSLVFDLNVEGEIEELIHFMFELSVSKPLMRIVDFQITEAQRSSIADGLGARFRIYVLAHKE